MRHSWERGRQLPHLVTVAIQGLPLPWLRGRPPKDAQGLELYFVFKIVRLFQSLEKTLAGEDGLARKASQHWTPWRIRIGTVQDLRTGPAVLRMHSYYSCSCPCNEMPYYNSRR